jgi:hypothetical protein
MPFDLTDNSSGLIPFLGLVLELDHLDLYAALGRATGSASRSVEYAALEAAVAGKPNEVGDALLFTKLAEIGTGKGCIPTEPKLPEPGPVALNKRRDKLQDAIGRIRVSGSYDMPFSPPYDYFAP